MGPSVLYSYIIGFIYYYALSCITFGFERHHLDDHYLIKGTFLSIGPAQTMLVYFAIGLQYYLGGVLLNSERPLSRGNWTSQPKTNFRVLTSLLKRLLSRQKRFYMTETFHHMLKFNFLYNVMVNYMLFPMNTQFQGFNYSQSIN